MKHLHKPGRRTFHKLFVASLASTVALSSCQRSSTIAKDQSLNSVSIPPRLKSGDRVGLIAPSSFASEDKVQKAHANLKAMGLEVVEGKYLREENGFMGGTDGERVEDLHAMFRRKDIQGIWCVRGGYGVSRILPMLDYELIRRNPKVLVGYSDITALHLAILTKTGLVTYHGPVGSSDFPLYAFQSVQSALFGDQGGYTVLPASEPSDTEATFSVLRSGRARGQLVGGNLTLLAALCGTEYMPDLTGKIVFMEDIGEASYRIDRMLIQLEQAANLKRAAGLIFGNFTHCDPEEGSRDQTVLEVIQDHCLGMGIPVVTGYSIGHIAQNATLGMGMMAELEADKGLISLSI